MSNNIVIIFVITFAQGIYNYVPETEHISRVCSVAAVLYLQILLHVMLFRTFTWILSELCVQWPVWLFLQFLDLVLSHYVAKVLYE
jgi:hypothetical protein